MAPAEAGGDFEELFAGLRSEGSWSLYFDEDPVIQFNPFGNVRRLFVDNCKYRVADAGRLVAELLSFLQHSSLKSKQEPKEKTRP